MTGKDHPTAAKNAAVFAAIWGLFVLCPYTDVFAKNMFIYRPMLSFAPYEAFWGGLFLAAGVAAYILAHTKRTIWATLILAVSFFSFAVMYLMADIESPAWALWGWLAVCNLRICWEQYGTRRNS